MQTNEETTSDLPGIDDRENNELHLNHINCESTDTESDTDNTISVNMITVENDCSHIILLFTYTRKSLGTSPELLHHTH